MEHLVRTSLCDAVQLGEILVSIFRIVNPVDGSHLPKHTTTHPKTRQSSQLQPSQSQILHDRNILIFEMLHRVL